MAQQEPATFFDQQHAASYDRRFARVAAIREALHLLTAAVLGDLPAEARILCVGAGTGLELIDLAGRFPGWHFTAVEPSGPMLAECRRKVEECGLTSRCEFHLGYLDSLSLSVPFDATTSILVSQFLLDVDARTQFFREMASRLRPGGKLVSADLCSDLASVTYQDLLEVWIRLMMEPGTPPEKVEAMRVTYSRDVAILPEQRICEMIQNGGFKTPISFFQAGLIHAWYATI